MIDELKDLLDIALDREIAAQAFYIAGQKKTDDPGAMQLMKELASEEEKHYEWIKDFKDSGPKAGNWPPKVLTDLEISENLIDTGIPSQAGLQDVITTAVKREQYSLDFYTKMKQVMIGESGKSLCDRLGSEERRHKMKLEKYYDEVFNKEN